MGYTRLRDSGWSLTVPAGSPWQTPALTRTTPSSLLRNIPFTAWTGTTRLFCQCDDASVSTTEKIARLVRDEDNEPEIPVVIRHIEIRPNGAKQ